MRLGFFIGLTILVFSFVLSVLNLVSGLQLSQSMSASAEGHFIRAILALSTALIGQCSLLVSSQTWLEDLGIQQLADMDRARADRQMALAYSFAHLITVVAAVITGTISYAGSFPIVHGILGFALTIVGLISLSFWVILSLRLSNR
ncbi:MAG: hypothetical protein EA369_08775 [Bradymonadales bacterium]|nr:MAG: hypothetical protein EA369_08775 [Bradymonadales bacterium]